jgi:hypothetical protein
MGLFKKKDKLKKQAKDKEEKSEVNKADFSIVIFDKLGGTVREITRFDAARFRDDLDHVVYLKNDKKKFLEIFPQDVNDFKHYTEKEVDTLIAKNQDLLEQERKNDSENVNDKNIEFELLKLHAKKRSFKFSENSSNLSFDSKGKPTFYYLREGSTFFPFKWDTETKNIFVPSDNRKKSASIALRNKESKYDTTKLVTGAAVLLIIIGIIFAAGGGYFMMKAKGAYSEAFADYEASNIAAIQTGCLQNINEVSNSLTNSANNIEKITKTIEDDLNKPQTVINGVIPE